MRAYLAFYKHKRPINSWQNLVYRLADDIIRLFTFGKYSHCELAIKTDENQTDYLCYSSSNRDGGVRSKTMSLPKDRWDLIEVQNVKLSAIEEFYKKTDHYKYDFLGAIGVVIGFGNSKRKYFCSEWCADVLNVGQPHKYSPNSLYRKFKNK